MSQAEMGTGELPIGVEVDGKALPQVEKFDKQLGAGAETLDVLGSEPRCRVRADLFCERRAIGQHRQAGRGLTEPGCCRSDPLFRASGASGAVPERTDAIPTPIEVIELVDRENDRVVELHDEHPHFASWLAIRSIVSRARACEVMLLPIIAKTSGRLSASMTIPASAATPVSVPVLARTTPRPDEVAFVVKRLTSVPVTPATANP